MSSDAISSRNLTHPQPVKSVITVTAVSIIDSAPFSNAEAKLEKTHLPIHNLIVAMLNFLITFVSHYLEIA